MNINWNNVRVLNKEKKIPDNAVQVHLYSVQDVLAPRGSLKKESLSEHILEALNSNYKSWTDEKMGDNPTKDDLVSLLKTNLDQEVWIAWREFLLQNSFGR